MGKKRTTTKTPDSNVTKTSLFVVCGNSIFWEHHLKQLNGILHSAPTSPISTPPLELRTL